MGKMLAQGMRFWAGWIVFLLISFTALGGELERVSIRELHPTQFTAGLGEVEEKRDRMREMGKKELKRYLKDKATSVVIGPGGVLWLVDGHHVALAAELAGLDQVYMRVDRDWSKDDRDAFFARMKREKKMWLYRGAEGPLDPRELPSHVRGLVDDPYRTLAWRVRKLDGYRETTIPFAEFMWAVFFRDRVGPTDLKKAVRLARSSEAKDLPGYIKPKE